MAAKKKSASLGDKVKKVLKDTAKQTGKDLLALGTIVGPGKAAKATSMVVKARAGQQVSSKAAKKVGDKLSGASSKRVQKKMHDMAMKDASTTAKFNKDLDGYGAYVWSKHPAMASAKGFDRSVNKGKTVTDRQTVRYRKAEDKAATKANARGLKAANKPTRASKNPEIRMTKSLAKSGKALGQIEPYATRSAVRVVDDISKLKASKKSAAGKASLAGKLKKGK